MSGTIAAGSAGIEPTMPFEDLEPDRLTVAGAAAVGLLAALVVPVSRSFASRCRTCGYTLRGLEAARCPECGTDATEARWSSPGSPSILRLVLLAASSGVLIWMAAEHVRSHLDRSIPSTPNLAFLHVIHVDSAVDVAAPDLEPADHIDRLIIAAPGTASIDTIDGLTHFDPDHLDIVLRAHRGDGRIEMRPVDTTTSREDIRRWLCDTGCAGVLDRVADVRDGADWRPDAIAELLRLNLQSIDETRIDGRQVVHGGPSTYFRDGTSTPGHGHRHLSRIAVDRAVPPWHRPVVALVAAAAWVLTLLAGRQWLRTAARTIVASG